MINFIKILLWNMAKKKLIKKVTEVSKKTDNKVDDVLVTAIIKALDNREHGLIKSGTTVKEG